MTRQGYCKICKLEHFQRQIIESLILNTGYFRSQAPRPHGAKQIAHVAYLCWGIELERHTIYRHRKKCMGNPKTNVPPHWNSKIREWVDSQGNIIPKFLKKDRH